MSKKGLIELLILLILLLALEGILLYRYPERGTYPFFTPSTPTTSSDIFSEPSSSPTGSDIFSGSTQPAEEPAVEPSSGETNPTGTGFGETLKNAVRVIDVMGQSVAPGGSGSTSYRETQQLIAQQNGATWDVTITTSNDRSASDVGRATAVIEADGTYYLTSFETSDANGTFSCSGTLPVYLAVGTDSMNANLSCTISGGSASAAPALSFSGTASSAAPTPTTFNGSSYQARTLTITGAVSSGASVAQGLEYTAAPGIGILSYRGSVGDLVFGQLLGVVSGETTGTLVSMDNDKFFLP